MIVKTSNKKINVFIVDDHPIIRRGLGQFLNSQEGIFVCGEAEDANQAIAALNSCFPDIVIVDLSLKGVSGIELIKAIKSRYKQINILVLSMHDEREYLERAIRAGARGYVFKQESEGKVVEAIYHVMNGGTYLSSSLKDKMLENILWESPREGEDSLSQLADRELEIFRLIGNGLNSRQIASALTLSISTVGTYRERIKTKLNLVNSAQLVKFAIQWVYKNEDIRSDDKNSSNVSS